MSDTTFDLASLDTLAAQEDGRDIRIVHPGTGADLGIVIKVAGPDSERVRKARAVVINARLARRNQKPLTADQLETEATRVTAAAVISWVGVSESGKPIECSQAEAERIFTKYPFIREQVDADAGDRAGFMKS